MQGYHSPYSSYARPYDTPKSYTATTTVSTSPPKSPTPRKVVSDFGAFSAPANASVFGTAVQSSPFSLAGGKAAFGGMRNGNNAATFGDEEEEEDDGRQRVELREDSITLDQVSVSLINRQNV